MNRTARALAALAAWTALCLASLLWLNVVRQPTRVLAAEDKSPVAGRASLNSPSRPKQDAAIKPVSASAAAPDALQPPPHSLAQQSAAQAAEKSTGCITCHKDAHDPHLSNSVKLGCTDCHGGNSHALTKLDAHVHPRFSDVFRSSANPIRSYTALNHENPEFIRFVNPGDLRVAQLSCGTAGCHGTETLHVKKSMMTHGCMLWGAALYNNGATPDKWPAYGESYSMEGTPQRLQTVPTPTPDETARKGVLPYLDPLPRFEITQPGNILRIFERGGRFVPDAGIPERLEESGRPRTRLSNRGLGTGNRTDPVFIGLQKTRLLDPTLNFLGTNDHPGDYRSSGCTACHMIYANDRSPVNSGPWARFGNRGLAAAHADDLASPPDPTIPKDEPGHPVTHRFTTSIPSSQCIVCHIHPGTTVMNSYLGFMWWDLETDARLMYPRVEKHPSSEEFTNATMSDPNEASVRGNWADPEFLIRSSELNPKLEHTQFSDFHGHGWMFQAVFRKNRQGISVDHTGKPLPYPSAEERQKAIQIPEIAQDLQRQIDWTQPDSQLLLQIRQLEAQLLAQKDNVPVHMLDIHLEKGMHCVDCHFVQDVHGNGKLYGEVRAAIEIQCIDCHGSLDPQNDGKLLITSGPAAAEDPSGNPVGRQLADMRTPFGKRRFEKIGQRLIQNSMVDPTLSWELTQVKDTVNPDHPDYNAASALAKTIRRDSSGQLDWGDPHADSFAHPNRAMSCIACHTSWNPSCYGCHLPQKAARKTPSLHNEGDISRNQVAYNFQTLRDEVFMLAKDGNVTGNRVGPSRSSCAIHVTSYNLNREAVYTQQQTISAEGLSGIAFSTNVPHTVRGKGETKSCTDCHLSADNDNNALMAQLLMQGTNYMNFIGRNAWVAAGEHGLFAVTVTERDEPQTVIGSTMHHDVYPQRYAEHVHHGKLLHHAHEHPGHDVSRQLLNPGRKHSVLNLQVRGEYCYAACGDGGIRIYDVAFIEHKGFSERIVTAPVSPVGQRFYVKTPFATDIAAPTTIAPDPTRTHKPENHETPVAKMYAYLYATDLHEGLVVIGAGTLLDGDPTNNFLNKDVVFNPNQILRGASSITIFGHYAWICCNAGLVVVDIQDPEKPAVVSILGKELLNRPRAVELQFRYGFVTDAEGLKVLDVTNPANPRLTAVLPLPEAGNLYVARTWAFIAGGKHGLIIVDVTNPEQPRLDQIFNAGGQINDLHDVKLGITYTSQFAYLADGHNGLHVVQLTSPDSPGYSGFSPQIQPILVASWKFPKGGEALAVAEGIDRDRAVDEAGNQLAVFGRVGARPLSLTEQQKLYLQPDGSPWFVRDPVRDWSIPSHADREQALHQQILQLYPHRSSQPTKSTIAP